MKKIYTNSNLAAVQILKAKLDYAEIVTLIKNASPPAAGELPPATTWPELWITHENDFDKAQQIMDEHLNQPIEDDWNCPSCKEQVAGELKLCWNCGESKQSQ